MEVSKHAFRTLEILAIKRNIVDGIEICDLRRFTKRAEGLRRKLYEKIEDGNKNASN